MTTAPVPVVTTKPTTAPTKAPTPLPSAAPTPETNSFTINCNWMVAIFRISAFGGDNISCVDHDQQQTRKTKLAWYQWAEWLPHNPADRYWCYNSYQLGCVAKFSTLHQFCIGHHYSTLGGSVIRCFRHSVFCGHLPGQEHKQLSEPGIQLNENEKHNALVNNLQDYFF